MAGAETDALLLRLLSGVRLFEGMTRADLVRLLALAEKEVFPPRAILVSEGDEGAAMYLVLAGQAEVYRARRDGTRRRLATLGPGDSLGEMALLEHGPRSATVRALSECVTLRLTHERLAAAPQVGAILYRNIARVVASRLKRANDLLLFDAGGGAGRQGAPVVRR